MRTLWSVVFVIAACGGGKSEQAGPVAPAEPAASADPAAAPAAPSAPAAPAAAADAAKLNDEGKQAMFGDKAADAEVKFRSALALDPQPLYAFNLCVAQLALGRFGDAKTACKTAAAAPDAALAGKANKLLQKIDAEAKKQGITLPP
ncbi:MAG: hypothetical protein JNL83_09015 [Myxococcales bacterium]|nr:hypothetical protein [Myxococcales bacterium]